MPRWTYCQPDYHLNYLISEYDRSAGHSEAELCAQYIAQLERVGVKEIRFAFATLATWMKEDGSQAEPVLCCHEKDGSHCHRSWFAEWWREKTGEDIPELSLATRSKPAA